MLVICFFEPLWEVLNLKIKILFDMKLLAESRLDGTDLHKKTRFLGK